MTHAHPGGPLLALAGRMLLWLAFCISLSASACSTPGPDRPLAPDLRSMLPTTVGPKQLTVSALSAHDIETIMSGTTLGEAFVEAVGMLPQSGAEADGPRLKIVALRISGQAPGLVPALQRKLTTRSISDGFAIEFERVEARDMNALLWTILDPRSSSTGVAAAAQVDGVFYLVEGTARDEILSVLELLRPAN